MLDGSRNLQDSDAEKNLIVNSKPAKSNFIENSESVKEKYNVNCKDAAVQTNMTLLHTQPVKLSASSSSRITTKSEDNIIATCNSLYINTIMDRTYRIKNFRKTKPLAICRIYANRPFSWFGITLSILLAMVLITVILFFSGYDILPVNFDTHPVVLLKSDVRRQFLAWAFSDSENELGHVIPDIDLNNPLTVYLMKLSVHNTFASIVFLNKSGNVLNKETLRVIQELENEIYFEHAYHGRYCLFVGVQDSYKCLKPLSLVRFFDGSFASINSVFYDPNFENISRVLSVALTSSLTRGIVKSFLGKHATVNNSSAQSSITKTVIYRSENIEAQNYVVKRWFEYLKMYQKRIKVKGLEVYLTSESLFQYEVSKTAMDDLIWIAGSGLFIFMFMWLQTASFFLTFWGIFSTLTSFVTSNLVYNLIFDYHYFGVFQILSIYVTLGIAADDVFIFSDTWKSLDRKKYMTVGDRLSVCYRRSVNSMFVTSFATTAAFFSSASNPVLAVSSFGTFSGIVIISNFISVVVFYPTVVLLYHKMFQYRYNINHFKVALRNCFCISNAASKISFSKSISSKYEYHSGKARFAVRLLSETYYKAVNNKIYQIVILTLVSSIVIVLGYHISLLTTDNKPPAFFQRHHPSEIAMELNRKSFLLRESSVLITLVIVWGLNRRNTDACHPREFKKRVCKGNASWSSEFNLNSAEAQSDLLNFCKDLKNLPGSTINRLKIKRQQSDNLPSVQCFILSMDEYFKEESRKMVNGTPKYALNLSIPMTPVKVKELIDKNPILKRIQDPSENFRVAYIYWMKNLGKQIPKDQRLLYGDMAFYKNTPGTNQKLAYGYAAIKVPLDMSWDDTSYREGLQLFKRWDKFIEEKTSKMSRTMQNPFHTSDGMEMEYFNVVEAIVNQCYVSILIGLLLAWFILVFISGNYIVGSMATICILCVVICVLGVIPLFKWKLGIFEALNLTLVVGLAVDYVVHMGFAYSHCSSDDRKSRVQYALEHMGVSVISGALTTLGSSLFMLGTRIAFFTQFSTFMLFTIGFSIFFAMSPFLVVLILIGPQGSTGSNKILIAKVREKYETYMRKRKVTASNVD